VTGAVTVDDARLVLDRPAVGDAALDPSDHVGIAAHVRIGDHVGIAAHVRIGDDVGIAAHVRIGADTP
jgi:UDP-3-O-[3-hydroxymyristoyl] glucosamine N-acyltransferase